MASDFHCTTQPPVDQPLSDQWIMLASDSTTGAIDTWDRHLMGREAVGGIALDVFSETVLGQIPRGWYDDDGDLLPKYRTDDGTLRLPEVFKGKPVGGHDGEYILGDWEPCNEGTQVILPSLDLDDIYDALEKLDWDVDDLEEVRDVLKDTFGIGDVEISHHGSLVLFCPRTHEARAWLVDHVESSAMWSGSRLVVEHRFANALIKGLFASGFHTRRLPRF